MSTRAVYTFHDERGRYHVYKHSDGYPEGMGACYAINAALTFAWPLPRFEADEFAAAFIAANKSSWAFIDLEETDPGNRYSRRAIKTKDAEFKRYGQYTGGGVRLIADQSRDGWKSHTNIEYRYEITCKKGKLHVTCFEVHCRERSGQGWEQKQIFSGSMSQFKAFCTRRDKENAAEIQAERDRRATANA